MCVCYSIGINILTTNRYQYVTYNNINCNIILSNYNILIKCSEPNVLF